MRVLENKTKSIVYGQNVTTQMIFPMQLPGRPPNGSAWFQSTIYYFFLLLIKDIQYVLNMHMVKNIRFQKRCSTMISNSIVLLSSVLQGLQESNLRLRGKTETKPDMIQRWCNIKYCEILRLNFLIIQSWTSVVQRITENCNVSIYLYIFA